MRKSKILDQLRDLVFVIMRRDQVLVVSPLAERLRTRQTHTYTYAKLHETPMTLPRTNIEKTLGKYSKKYVYGFATVSGHLCSSFYLTTLITKVLFLDDLI